MMEAKGRGVSSRFAFTGFDELDTTGVHKMEAARQLGVSRHVLWGWTSNRKQVRLKFIPKVVEWPGYGPFPEPGSFGARLRQRRRAAGLSQTVLGKLPGIRAGTIGDFGRGRVPDARHRARVGRFMGETP